MLRPCGICHFEYLEHKIYKDLGNIFCPDQDFMEGPVEAFDCYIPCDNLEFLEWLHKQKCII
jgi:hypothetical protein